MRKKYDKRKRRTGRKRSGYRKKKSNKLRERRGRIRKVKALLQIKRKNELYLLKS